MNEIVELSLDDYLNSLVNIMQPSKSKIQTPSLLQLYFFHSHRFLRPLKPNLNHLLIF